MVFHPSVIKMFGPSIFRASPWLITHYCQVYRGISVTNQRHDRLNGHSSSASSAFSSEKVDNQLVARDHCNNLGSSISPVFKSEFLDEIVPNARLQELDIHPDDALDICNENVSDFVVPLQPTTTFAAYVNDSPTLQELVKLGVQLWKFEKYPDLCNYILQLDFDRDIKNHLLFLLKIGIPGENFGSIITKNPLIFKEDIENLQIRVNYLESKRFSPDEIASIVNRYPIWLSRSTQEIDSRLGFLQQIFGLSGREVRIIAAAQPKAIIKDKGNISALVFSLKEEMGFSNENIKGMVVAAPNLLNYESQRLIRAFDELHNNIGIPHQLIVKQPAVLTHQPHRIRWRHLYLKFLKRDQYDPKKENYVSILALAAGTDAEFCKNVAKTSIESYNTFLKTL